MIPDESKRRQFLSLKTDPFRPILGHLLADFVETAGAVKQQ